MTAASTRLPDPPFRASAATTASAVSDDPEASATHAVTAVAPAGHGRPPSSRLPSTAAETVPGDAVRDQGAALLRGLREVFDASAAALARRVVVDGAPHAARLDEEQFCSYELALAAADLYAAETVLDPATAAGTPALEQALTRAFAAEAMEAAATRLKTLSLELGLDGAVLAATVSGSAWTAFRQAAGSGRALAALGAQVADAAGDVGALPLDADTAMAQDTFRRFAAEVVAPLAEQIHREDLTVPEALLQPLREMGVFGLSIPEQYGGSASDAGGGTALMVAVTEALSEGSLAAAGSLITRPEILARALMEGGSPRQRAHWLPRIAAGEPLCAISITEPDYGSDVASLALRATPVAGGGWRLDGAKTWCTFAGKAGLLMVVARTDPDRALGHRGLSIFLVKKPVSDGHAFEVRQDGGGLLRGHAIPTIGYRGMHSFDLSFEGFVVPAEALLGEQDGLGKGFYYTMAGMTGGRMQTSGRACGVMRAALRAAARYAVDRKVFGKPLADFPLTQVKLAQMAGRYVACRQVAYRVAALLDAGAGRMESSLVKLLACRSAETVTREALQIHGGMGYAEEMPVSRYFVDARVLSIFEGAEETLALKVIARSLIDAAAARR